MLPRPLGRVCGFELDLGCKCDRVAQRPRPERLVRLRRRRQGRLASFGFSAVSYGGREEAEQLVCRGRRGGHGALRRPDALQSHAVRAPVRTQAEERLPHTWVGGKPNASRAAAGQETDQGQLPWRRGGWERPVPCAEEEVAPGVRPNQGQHLHPVCRVSRSQVAGVSGGAGAQARLRKRRESGGAAASEALASSRSQSKSSHSSHSHAGPSWDVAIETSTSRLDRPRHSSVAPQRRGSAHAASARTPHALPGRAASPDAPPPRRPRPPPSSGTGSPSASNKKKGPCTASRASAPPPLGLPLSPGTAFKAAGVPTPGTLFPKTVPNPASGLRKAAVLPAVWVCTQRRAASVGAVLSSAGASTAKWCRAAREAGSTGHTPYKDPSAQAR
eukprot:scaffold14532_cov101-Isochrysis_galbana.AAC.3